MSNDKIQQQFALRPTGDDPEFDPQFHNLVQEIEGREEVQYGEQIYRPEDID